MLMPSRTKYRKMQKGRVRGRATKGCNLTSGDFGLQTIECGHITSRQIESARIAMSRFIKKGGKILIRIFPDKPITKKPLETRQGKGKGPVEGWVAPVRVGRVLYELEGVNPAEAKEALVLASHKLPVATRILSRENYRDA